MGNDEAGDNLPKRFRARASEQSTEWRVPRNFQFSIFIFQLALLLLYTMVSATETGKPHRGFFVSYSGGYTHYNGADLNDVMQALADQSANQGGLNRYDVDRFDGHPRMAATVGGFYGNWNLGLEFEFWVEEFGQRDVPFYVNRELDPVYQNLDKVSCDYFRQPGFAPVESGVAGCIDAREIFTIIPLTLQLTHSWYFRNRSMVLSAGYGAGILAGDAKIIVETEFVGADARPNDTMEITLWPGINLVQKFLLDAEWRPVPAVGLALRSGWRFSQMQFVEIEKVKGSSFLFGLILGDDSSMDEGDRAWLLRNDASGEKILMLRAEPTDGEKRAAELSGYRYQQVAGDFSGWFLELKANLYFDMKWTE